MKSLSRYLSEICSFEEKIIVLLSVSEKIMEDSKSGFQKGGRVSVNIDDISSKDQLGVEVFGSISNIHSLVISRENPEALYKITVEDFIATLKKQKKKHEK